MGRRKGLSGIHWTVVILIGDLSGFFYQCLLGFSWKRRGFSFSMWYKLDSIDSFYHQNKSIDIVFSLK